MTALATRPAGRRLGNQEPTTVVEPPYDGERDTLDGLDCTAFAARFGLVLDPWQAALTQLWMSRCSVTGKWLAGTWGISVPRQNGKNGTLEAVELYGVVVLKLRFLHTAHEVKTAQKHFRRMRYFFGDKRNDPDARFPELNRLVREVRRTNAQEAIYLWNPDTGEDLGSIEIVARSKSSARGFTNDVLVLDEAQHLKDEELEALRPAISAAPQGDPVAIYMGTPPKPSAFQSEGEGAAFMRVRNQAVGGNESGRAAWMEFGLDVNLDHMSDDELLSVAKDLSHWYTVNPALGLRLNEQTLIDELTEMGPRSFCRERLNVWPSPKALAGSVLDMDAWEDQALGRAQDAWPLEAIGLDMDVTGRLWVGVCAGADDNVKHIELLPYDPLSGGLDAVVAWLWERCRKRLPIVMDNDSGAAVLEAPLRAKGMKVYRLNIQEQVQVASGMVQALKDHTVTHLDDPVLAKAIEECGRATLSSGQWRLGRTGDLSGAPLHAVSCARFGAVKWPARRRTGQSYYRS